MSNETLTPLEQYWLKHYQTAIVESESLSAYARENGIAKQTFLTAVRRLCRKGLVHRQSDCHSVSPYVVATSPCTEKPLTALTVTLTLPSGVVLEISHLPMNRDELAQIVPFIQAVSQPCGD